jgi:protein SCO1/2
MNWRLASRLSVIICAVLVVIVVLVFQYNEGVGAPPAPPSPTHNANVSFAGLQGTDLGGTPAPNFQLTDQNGKPVSLAQFHGEPVVLTFMYTHCPDECPLNAGKLHQAMLTLGSNAHNVGVIVVSTDPKGDTQAAAQNFTKVHGMQDYWHYLLGTQQELAPIWSEYHIYVLPTGETVEHTIGVYIIDKQGRERVYMDDSFTPSQVVTDLQTLLKE